ncbi:MAG TPA: hypothetical protein VGF59_29505 [Bryobacteraceae bacterium]|jgi:hypothetical protein
MTSDVTSADVADGEVAAVSECVDAGMLKGDGFRLERCDVAGKRFVASRPV